MKWLVFAFVLAACHGAEANVPEGTLAFRRDGRETARLTLRQLARVTAPEIVDTEDPYYGRHKRFRALRLEPILRRAYGIGDAELRTMSFVLRASDGYSVPMEGSRLLEGGAYVAFDDVDVPGFAPIGPRRVSPAPAYLVWNRPGQSNLATHPRPWQLVTVEIASFAQLYPHAVPAGVLPGSLEDRGFALFRNRCIRCHAINREGGRVGPDLNVPQSIVEYRPAAQIRAYIRNPREFRYGSMPAHADLDDSDLDALIAYFGTMARQKNDPHDPADEAAE